MTTFLLFVTAIISYLLGGINGAIISSKYIFHRDIRDHGSKNAGLTNYYRTFGAPGTVLVLGIDIVKSVVSVLAGRLLLGIVGHGAAGAVFAAFCLMLGHDYPAYYGFKGGKGVLCAGAAIFIINWRVGLVCLAVFLIMLVFTRIVSLSSLVGSLFIPIGIWVAHMGALEGVLGLFCFLLILFKHRDNIGRLLSHSEPKLNLSSRPERKLDE